MQTLSVFTQLKLIVLSLPRPFFAELHFSCILQSGSFCSGCFNMLQYAFASLTQAPNNLCSLHCHCPCTLSLCKISVTNQSFLPQSSTLQSFSSVNYNLPPQQTMALFSTDWLAGKLSQAGRMGAANLSLSTLEAE